MRWKEMALFYFAGFFIISAGIAVLLLSFLGDKDTFSSTIQSSMRSSLAIDHATSTVEPTATVAPHFFRIKVVDIDSDPRMDCTVRLRVRSSKTVFPTGVQKNRITDKDGLAYWKLDVGLYKFQVDCDGLGESSWVNGEMRHGQGALEPCQQDTGNIIMFDLKPQMPGVPHTENIRATFTKVCEALAGVNHLD